MTQPAPAPYLSVVVATRNDDHGGDPLKRLQAFVNTFAAQCRRSGLDAEVIVVEWNPPSDKPRVSELCRVPPDTPFPVRFVEVPAELHQRLRFSSVLPLFQMIAKSVGIRRARGRFVLATNIDVIFSAELVDHLASGRLRTGHLYRLDRHDIESNYPVDGDLDEQMAYCRTHQLRLHARSGTHPVDSLGRLKPLVDDIVASAGVALGEGWDTREGEPGGGFFRWAQREARIAVDRGPASERSRGAVLDVEVEPNPYQPDAWIDLEIVSGARRLGRRRVSNRTRMRFELPDDVPHHDLVLRLLDSSGGRAWLPLFESREPLCYRVYHVSVHAVPGHEYAAALWHRVSRENAKLRVKRSSAGVEVTSDPGKYSYCTQYGALESPADGRYEFLLEYTAVSGRLAFAAMDDDRRCWLPAASVEIELDTGRAVALAVDVPRGTKFSLFVSNNRPEGGVSELILGRLFGSVPLERLRRKDLPARIGQIGHAVGARVEFLAQPLRALKSKAASIELARARRFHPTIVEDSERVRQLEARVASLLPLTDLAPVAQLLRDHRPIQLHQNACGDFQLMAREHWFALRAYPEFEMFSMSIDGLFEAIACTAGIREEVFAMPLCIYHLEHEKGSGWSPEGEALLKQRIAESGITWLDNDIVHLWAACMQWLRRPMIFNGPDWGLGDTQLPETTIRAVADHVR